MSVVKGEIQVDLETAVVYRDTGAVIWNLAPSARGYKFADGGIRFEFPAPRVPSDCSGAPSPVEFFDLSQCKPTANGRQFVCPTGKSHVPGACFKYTIKLEPQEGNRPVPDKDPWIKDQ